MVKTATKKTLLRANAEMRKDHVWNWTLPAFVTKLPDGRNINVCPQAGACAKVCYARNGTFLFPKVLESHQRNLMLAMDTPEDFKAQMLAELAHKRFRPKYDQPRLPDIDKSHLSPWVRTLLDAECAAVRIHDSGDFFSDEYLITWLEIAEETPDVLFYAYSKEVTRFRKVLAERDCPVNFLYVFSLGGKEDHLLDLELDRHADVFPTPDDIQDAWVLRPNRK